LVPDIINTQHT